MAALMEAEPMGLQFGLLTGPSRARRSRSCARATGSAWRSTRSARTRTGAQTGVAMITAADDAMAAHQRVAEASWRDAVKGPAGAARLRELAAATVPG